MPGRLAVSGRPQPISQTAGTLETAEKHHLTGWVEDMRPFVARGAVCIVPLRIGGGTRLKIFEAMAMEKAVVSTSVGAEGLPVQNRENILIADGEEDFARTCVELLGNAALRNRIGSEARRLVCAKYGWAKIADTFTEALQRVTRASAIAERPVPSSSESS